MEQQVFSPTESKVLKLLEKTKKTTIQKLTDRFYKDIKKKPLNGSAVISGAIRNINRKTEYHKLKWFVNGEGLGRGGKTVWLDKTS